MGEISRLISWYSKPMCPILYIQLKVAPTHTRTTLSSAAPTVSRGGSNITPASVPWKEPQAPPAFPSEV